MANPIDFYFDFSSPYGYFASARIEDIASRHGRTVTWRRSSSAPSSKRPA